MLLVTHEYVTFYSCTFLQNKYKAVDIYCFKLLSSSLILLFFKILLKPQALAEMWLPSEKLVFIKQNKCYFYI